MQQQIDNSRISALNKGDHDKWANAVCISRTKYTVNEADFNQTSLECIAYQDPDQDTAGGETEVNRAVCINSEGEKETFTDANHDDFSGTSGSGSDSGSG